MSRNSLADRAEDTEMLVLVGKRAHIYLVAPLCQEQRSEQTPGSGSHHHHFLPPAVISERRNSTHSTLSTLAGVLCDLWPWKSGIYYTTVCAASLEEQFLIYIFLYILLDPLAAIQCAMQVLTV